MSRNATADTIRYRLIRPRIVLRMRTKRVRLVNRSGMWHQYIAMARRIAGDFSKKFGRPYEELREVAESELGIRICTWGEHYKGEKSRPITWIYKCIYWRCRQHCDAVHKEKMRCVSLTDNPLDAPHERGWLQRIMEELGEEGRMLVKALAESPSALVSEIEDILAEGVHPRFGALPEASREARNALRKGLRAGGWSRETVKKAFGQIREAM